MAFEIRGIITGNVIKTIKNPAALIETDFGILHFIGERDEMPEQLQKHLAKKDSFNRNIPKLVIVELPHDQEEVTKAFSKTGYALELYKQQNRGVIAVSTETDI